MERLPNTLTDTSKAPPLSALHSRSTDGLNLLHSAALHGMYDLIPDIHGIGFDVNGTTLSGETVLDIMMHQAERTDHWKSIVWWLLGNGAKHGLEM